MRPHPAFSLLLLLLRLNIMRELRVDDGLQRGLLLLGEVVLLLHGDRDALRQ